WGVSRHKYKTELALERINRMPYPKAFESYEARRGIELEPVARELYATVHGVDVVPCGFIKHPTIPWTGASPDGLVGDDGLVEIKCLATHLHMEVARTGVIDTSYLAQVQWQLACTGRQWCEYVGYDDRVQNMRGRLWTHTLRRDDEIIMLM